MNEQIEMSLINQIFPGVKIIFLNRKIKSKSILPFIKLNYYLIKNRFDIVHAHAAELGNILNPFLNFKLILHVHSTVQITNSKLPKYDQCIVISKIVKKTIQSQFNSKNITVVYNGINFSQFTKKTDINLSRKIISVGRLDNRIKNQSTIIKEFKQIENKIDASLYFVGDGEDLLFLEGLVEKLDLKKRVFFIGSKSQNWIKKNLFKYDLFIQSSSREGLGISAIEASASCLPMILSNRDGHKEISENGLFCKLFEPEMKGELGGLILDFYINRKIYFKKSIDNWKHFKRKFDLNNCNENILKVYNKSKYN